MFCNFQEHGELEFRRGDVITVTDKSDKVILNENLIMLHSTIILKDPKS